jgi:hypothetical protein
MKGLIMVRTLACLFCLGGLTLGMVGCAEHSKVKEQTKVETPSGSDTKTVTTEEKKTGDMKDNKENHEAAPATTTAPNP